MRVIRLICWSALLLIIGVTIGCDEEQVSPRVCALIHVRSVSWNSWFPDGTVDSTETYVACSAETFGPRGEPFYVVRVITNVNIEISFDESLVICGESIADPSQYETVHITPDTTCFRTRTYDGGVDYYLWADGNY